MPVVRRGTFSCPWFFPCLLRKSPPDPGRFSSAVDIWDRRLEVRRPRSNNQSQISCVTSRAAGWGARRQEGRCVVVGQGRAAVPARGPAGGSGPTYWSRRTGGCCPLRRQRSRSTDRVQLSGRQCRRRCWSPKRELPASGMNPLTERYGFDTVVTPLRGLLSFQRITGQGPTCSGHSPSCSTPATPDVTGRAISVFTLRLRLAVLRLQR